MKLQKQIFYTLFFFLNSLTINAQEYNLDTVVLHRHKEKYLDGSVNFKDFTVDSLIYLPANTLDELLETQADIDIRSRGPKGVQSDLHIRGANFDQAALFVNEMPFVQPQTGHHLLQLPLSLIQVASLQIVSHPASYFLGGNAYAGALFLETVSDHSHLKINSEAGQYGYMKSGVTLHLRRGQDHFFTSASYARSDGYLFGQNINNTDFRDGKIFVSGQKNLLDNRISITAQGGYLNKYFGANSFYTSRFPWQYEHIKNYYGGLKIRLKPAKKIRISTYTSANRNFDRFELFRESVYVKHGDVYINQQGDTAAYAPGFYYRGPNLHRTDNITSGISSEYKTGKFFDGLELRQTLNRIYGNKLGYAGRDSIYDSNEQIYLNRYAFQRINEIILRAGKDQPARNAFQWHTGLNLLFYGGKLYPVFGAESIYRSDKYDTGFNISQGYRIPTFTDLFYRGPDNVGNPLLIPEKSLDIETFVYWKKGIFPFKAGIWYRHGTNTIDWIKYRPNDPWKPENLTVLNSGGIYFSFNKHYRSKLFRQIGFSYQYQLMNKPERGFYSKYALDYLRHKAVFSLTQQPFENLRINWLIRYKDRQGKYLIFENGGYTAYPYKDYFLVDAKISYQIKHWLFYLNIDNVLNTRYHDLSYVRMPGRWLTAGVQWNILLEKP